MNIADIPQRRKVVMLVVAGLLVLGLVFWWLSGDDSEMDPIDEPPISEELSEDESLESEEDEEQSEDSSLPEAKQEDDDDDNAGNVSPQVNPSGVENDVLTVRGFVPSIVEDGGDCEFFLFDAGGNQIASQLTLGFADATSTVCTPATFNVDGQSKVLQVQLKYDSTNYSGEGPLVEVSI